MTVQKFVIEIHFERVYGQCDCFNSDGGALMKRLNNLWVTIVIGCFLNLLIGLAHWSGIVTSQKFAYLNLGVSTAMILLVIISSLKTRPLRQLPAGIRERLMSAYIAAIFIALLTEWH